MFLRSDFNLPTTFLPLYDWFILKFIGTKHSMIINQLLFLLNLFVIFANTQSQSNNQQHCSREQSRQVHLYVLAHVYPQLSSSELKQLPNYCPFSPHQYIYLYQENNKTELSIGEWRCQHCRKVFVNEFYLDKHMENKHVETLQVYK